MADNDNTPRRQASAHGFIPGLDGLRGVAILLVLVYHQTLLSPDGAASPLDRVVAHAARAGWCGVDLFFVLSGFLITGILLDTKGRAGFFTSFYARRTLRIFPLYYAVVALSFVIIPVAASAGMVPATVAHRLSEVTDDQAWYWLYLSNISVALAGRWRHPILDVSWSLAIEEQFYLVWPCIVATLSRQSLRRACVLLILACPAVRLIALTTDVLPIAIYVLTPFRVDALAMGAFVAIYFRERNDHRTSIHTAMRIGTLAAAGLAAIAVLRGGLWPMDPFVQFAGFTLAGLLGSALLLLTVNAQPGTSVYRMSNSRVLRLFGKYSYALYLFHLPIRAVIRDRVYGTTDLLQLGSSQLPGQLIFYGLATAVTLALAVASWYVFEGPILELKRCFPRPEPCAAVATTSDNRSSPGV